MHWLNWTNANPFRLCGPSNSPLFLPVFMLSAELPPLEPLGLGSDVEQSLHVDKGQEPFLAGRLCFNFQPASYCKYKTKPLLRSCFIFSTHGRVCLFWIFGSYMLFLFSRNNDVVMHLPYIASDFISPGVAKCLTITVKLAPSASYYQQVETSEFLPAN